MTAGTTIPQLGGGDGAGWTALQPAHITTSTTTRYASLRTNPGTPGRFSHTTEYSWHHTPLPRSLCSGTGGRFQPERPVVFAGMRSEEELTKAVYFSTAELLKLEVDLIFFDGSTSYWETDGADPDWVNDEGEVVQLGFRQYGHSKDHRPDLPQVLIGMAVTKEGIPIRVWSWPGDTGESPLLRQVRDPSSTVTSAERDA